MLCPPEKVAAIFPVLSWRSSFPAIFAPDQLPAGSPLDHKTLFVAATSEDSEDVMYSISDMARMHSLTLRALRFYEKNGLVAPRREGLRRVYSQADSERIAEIVRLTRFGFTLRQIRNGKITPAMMDVQLELLRDRRREMDAAIETLRSHLVSTDFQSVASATRR